MFEDAKQGVPAQDRPAQQGGPGKQVGQGRLETEMRSTKEQKAAAKSAVLPLAPKRKKLEQTSNGKPFQDFVLSCCLPRVPNCCSLGTEMLWQVGGRMVAEDPGATAQQPSTYNPKCLNSVDFDTVPLGTFGQPFCHEITPVDPANIQAAQLELIIWSRPPCGKKDSLCLTMSTGEQWCHMLEDGENHLCLDLDELGLLTTGIDTLLIRAAHYSFVDYLRLHTIMCESVDPVPAVLPSLNFDFENSLVGTPGGTVTAVNGPVSYLSGGPQGTSIDFPGSAPTNVYLQLPDVPSQDGGTALSMAAWVYFDEPGYNGVIGYPFVTKLGSYRWMINPGQPWYWQHVHLGPGPGDLCFATPRASQPDFTVPVQKWLCVAVTIDIDAGAGTTTLHYYLNGELWGPPSVYNNVYSMDGSADLLINGNIDIQNWKGKLDRLSVWQSVISPKDVSTFCNCQI